MSNNFETRRIYDTPVVVRSGQKPGRVCCRCGFKTIGTRQSVRSLVKNARAVNAHEKDTLQTQDKTIIAEIGMSM